MIEKRQQDIIELPLDPVAEEQVRSNVEAFTTDLLMQAKTNAHRQGDNIVLARHVREALNTINQDRTQSWGRQIQVILGGAFIGAFPPGFITEITAGPSHMHLPLLVIYTILGFIGMLLVFIGLRR